MAFEAFESDDSAAIDHVLVTVASQVFLVCATILSFFVYLQLPLSTAAAASLAVLFLGSLLCWKDYGTAQNLLVVSLLVSEFVILSYIPWLLIPFFLLDVLVILFLFKVWSPKDE